jgi:hypothetical protein
LRGVRALDAGAARLVALLVGGAAAVGVGDALDAEPRDDVAEGAALALDVCIAADAGVGHRVAAGGARDQALQVVQAADAGLAVGIADLAAAGALVVVHTRDAYVAAGGVADLARASAGDFVDALHALVRGHVTLRGACRKALGVAEALHTNSARGVADGFVAATLGGVGTGDAALVGFEIADRGVAAALQIGRALDALVLTGGAGDGLAKRRFTRTIKVVQAQRAGIAI